MLVSFLLGILMTLVMLRSASARDNQSSANGITLAGTPLTAVIYPPASSATIKFAASELSRYLAKATGSELIAREGQPEAGAFYITNASSPQLRVSFKARCFDRAVALSQNGTVYLVGENDRSALYCVYDFLQQYAKIEFFGPGESHECIPPVRRITLSAAMNTKYGSDMDIRDYYMKPDEPVTVDFLAKNRINLITGFADLGAGLPVVAPYAAEIRKRGMLIRGPLHNWSSFILDPKLFDEHPEYFPVVGGKRTVNNRTACFSNPKAVEIFMNNWREFVRKKRGAWDIITFWPEDIPDPNYCCCPECVKEPNSNWYIMLVSKAAKIVEEEAPGTVFEFIAYHSLRTPPTWKVELPSNGRNMLMNLCIGYDRDLYIPIDGEPECNRKITGMMDNWLGYLKSVGFRGRTMIMDYYNLCEMPGMGPRTHAFLWPVDVIQKDSRYYLKRGITGVGDWVLYFNLCVPTPLMMWSWLKVWSDTRLNLRKLEDRFYSAYFGELGRQIGDYMRRMTELMHELTPLDCAKNVAQIEKLVASLGSISTSALSEPVKHRLDVVKVHGLYCILLKKAYTATVTGDKAKSDAYRKEFAAFFTETHYDVLKTEIDMPPFGTDYWWFCIESYAGFEKNLATDPRLH
ncbi:MAG: DUF4838 domain-containing protein [Armatimonadota bacterium]